MPYEFIDNNGAIGCSARKQIRRHVAMGRNAGKKLVRPSRKKAFEQQFNTNAALTYTPRGVEKTGNNVVPEIERQIGDGLSVLCVPVQLIPRSRPLIRRVLSFLGGPRHAPEMDDVLDATGMRTSIWVQFMFLDEAYFHCIIALSVTILDSLAIKQEGPIVATRHISQTLRLVNERLSGNNSVSDQTIAVVLMMAQYERHQGRYRQGIVHIKGLQQMIDLRGGISQLAESNPYLTQKIFRLDLDYALYMGTATRFGVEDILFGSKAISGLYSHCGRWNDQSPIYIYYSPLFRQLSTDLQDLLIDVTNLARLLNDTSSGKLTKIDNYTFHDTILLLGYRILAIRPLRGPRPLNRIEDVIQLGLATFVATFFWTLDRKIPSIPLLSELVRSVAQGYTDDNTESQKILLWLLFIGTPSIFTQLDDDVWLIPKTAQTMNTLGLYTWEDVRRTLIVFPWVNAFHDQAGKTLWHRLSSRYGFLAESSQNELVRKLTGN